MATYDLIVGIPSYNEADSISFVTKQVDKGLTKYFPKLRTIIVNVDNCSPDNTRDIFLNTETKNKKLYISTLDGVKGKGNNFYNLFLFAQETNAKTVVVVDADLTSITPQWIKKLADPIIKKHDFVSPLYIRHKYDGTITNNVVFPLVYSLFNKFIRQPIGGEFAISKKLIDHYMEQEWTNTTRQYGIDIFMTLNALCKDFKTTQVLLGAKLHKPSAPKLGEMFIQVINTLFGIITDNKQNFKRIEEMPKIEKNNTKIEPPEISINPEEIKKTAIENFEQNKKIIKKNLHPKTFEKVKNAFKNNDINITDELWSKILLQYLNKYETSKDKLKLIESLKALYFGRTYTFMKQTKDMKTIEAEKLIIEQAKIFWKNKKIFLKPRKKSFLEKIKSLFG